METRLNLNESGERFEGIVSIDELRANGVVIPEDKSSGVTSSGLEWTRVGDATGIALSIPVTKISVLVEKFGAQGAQNVMRFVGYIPLAITSLSNWSKVQEGKISKEQGIANILTDTAYTVFATALASATAAVTGMTAGAAGIAAIVVATLGAAVGLEIPGLQVTSGMVSDVIDYFSPPVGGYTREEYDKYLSIYEKIKEKLVPRYLEWVRMSSKLSEVV